MSFCLVSFHAHPDDEALLTAGTLARAAAEGHRVVLVVATGGEAGLSDTEPGSELAARRAGELDRSAAALGCAKVIRLDYPDSGMRNEHRGFASLPVEEPAERLAGILRAERADALTVYDRNGGYGHPDHVQVHRVGHRAAKLAGTPLVLEATVDRTVLLRAVALVRWTGLLPAGADRLRHSYSDRTAITHRIDVRRYAGAKRRSMAAHASQATGGDRRTLALFTRLPGPLYRRVFGTEWFIEAGRPPGSPPLGDLFASLRPTG
ncbi:PIG-L deacetylase family protein [Jatrophihabitans sp.]|uniref:PIG-L deacetylase family protein n=1 Tax=Jatrophihabitans sp. TaxID=1932789 RepID=UPI002BA9C3ED|nr:PIG-L family deacetylase [Jatrophihabitans sp.]